MLVFTEKGSRKPASVNIGRLDILTVKKNKGNARRNDGQ